MKILRAVVRLANNPWVMIVAGLFLAVASVMELGEELLRMGEGVEGEHGTFVYGVIVMVKSLGDLGEVDEGLGRVGEGREKLEGPAGEE